MNLQRTSSPAFVVSTGRCGSTVVSNILRLHPDILSLSELFSFLMPDPFPPGPMDGRRFWDLLSTPRERWTFLMRHDILFDEVLYRPRDGGRFTRETGVPPILLTTLPHIVDEPERLLDEIAGWAVAQGSRTVADHYRGLFRWLGGRLGRRVWVERSGASLPRVLPLASLFPEARFVHLYRDGRDCAVSMSRHSGYRLMWMQGLLPLVLDSDPGRRRRPAMPDGFDRDRFVSMRVPLDVLGKFWSDMVVQGVADLRQLDAGRVLDMCYETLVREPAAQLRRLARFMEVEEDDEWVARAAALLHPRPASWMQFPHDELESLAGACAPAMELLYGPGWTRREARP